MVKDYNNFNTKPNGVVEHPESIILYQNRRQTTYLFKFLLVILEDLRDQNLLSEEYFNQTRTRILDVGNQNIRDLEELIEKFEIRYKKH